MRGQSLYVRTVCRRLILTSKVGHRDERVKLLAPFVLRVIHLLPQPVYDLTLTLGWVGLLRPPRPPRGDLGLGGILGLLPLGDDDADWLAACADP